MAKFLKKSKLFHTKKEDSLKNKPALVRILGLLCRYYPVLIPVTFICIVFSAIVSSIPAIFIQKVLAIVDAAVKSGNMNWDTVKSQILPMIVLLASMYILALTSIGVYRQLMAYITQGFLKKLRNTMFNTMQNLPVKYFDTHKHGDIMSYYTNDIDSLRQLISEALPQLIQSAVIVLSVFCIMLYYSFWMTIVVVIGVIAMVLVSKKAGGGSAKFFIKQQDSLGKTEGFVQEIMNGQKVIKVFNHEEQSKADFDKLNNELFDNSYHAHAYANCLGPVIMNIGNLLYVFGATAGGIFLLTQIPNYGLMSIFAGAATAITIDIVVPFLNMTKQFTGNVNQVSQQINSIVMAMAGSKRIFALMDEVAETDIGYVTLVNAEIDQNGNITETEKHTGKWAWKHPHSDGTLTYSELKGDVRFENVTFGYKPEKAILHDITLYAKPGQKVAFVGATGAGKTTITNLINRYYELTEGKIRYDGINTWKIHKSDLRRSLGIVLQDTNLFTGTVMDNIRYGRLDASNEQCIEAAKLAGADDFITRLPDGYNTMLSNNGSNLSQGQRQLLSIARAAVADPPVMILDEATSSIDTRTEAIVQKGMDKLMEGRTVFVIAHRLSTVMNADVIMVLDHGVIIERGTHDDLIKQHGVYYQLYTGAFELE